MDLRCSSCSITESVVFLICCFIVASAWDLVAQPLQMSSMGVGREGGEGGTMDLFKATSKSAWIAPAVAPGQYNKRKMNASHIISASPTSALPTSKGGGGR